jgi:2-polyprenyl-6-methoxyphenol hydroxylase-like FAD-dependent oxidoreductase
MGGEGSVAEIEILRGELSRILHQEMGNNAEYRFDDSIESLVQDVGGVHVTFVNSPPRRFDLVIAADGVFSPTRRLAFDGSESPASCRLVDHRVFHASFAHRDGRLVRDPQCRGREGDWHSARRSG